MDPLTQGLATLEVLDPQARPVRLGDFFCDKPALLVFVRHFGCLFCREQIAQLRGAAAEIEAAGVRLVVIGNGLPEQADIIRRDLGLTFALLVDPDLRAYRAAGLARGVRTTLSPRTLLHAIRAFRSGHRQGHTQGDIWQQGGVLLITPAGDIPYRHISREAGDHPTPAELLVAVQALRGDSTGSPGPAAP